MADELTDLMKKLEELSENDRLVLARLKVDRPVISEEIASSLYLLPSSVYASIQKLKDLLLVDEELQTDTDLSVHPITLTEMGRKVRALTRAVTSPESEKLLSRSEMTRYQ